MPTSLGALLLSVQMLVTIAVGLSVDTDARLRSTALEGEAMVSAIRRFEHYNGELPARIDLLVPRYLREVPIPLYGVPEWEYYRGPVEHAIGDVPIGIGLPITDAMTAREKRAVDREFSLTVRLDRTTLPFA